MITYSSLKFCVSTKTKVKFWKYFTDNASLKEGRCEHIAGAVRVEIYSPRLSPRILTVSLHTFPSPGSMVQLPPPSISCGDPWISCPQDPGLSNLSPWGPAPTSVSSFKTFESEYLSTLTMEIFFLAPTSEERQQLNFVIVSVVNPILGNYASAQAFLAPHPRSLCWHSRN